MCKEFSICASDAVSLLKFNPHDRFMRPFEPNNDAACAPIVFIGKKSRNMLWSILIGLRRADLRCWLDGQPVSAFFTWVCSQIRDQSTLGGAFMRAIRAVSEAYMAISLGLLVRDLERRAIGARGRFIGDESEKIGVFNAPSIRRAIEISAPGILTDRVSSPREFLRGNRPDLVYLVMPA
jgi:hypothetical protein